MSKDFSRGLARRLCMSEFVVVVTDVENQMTELIEAYVNDCEIESVSKGEEGRNMYKHPAKVAEAIGNFEDAVKRLMDFYCVNGVWKDGAGRELDTFPIQKDLGESKVPLCVAEEAYKEYSARYGTNQTLQRLGERGGFGSSEIAILLYERCKRLECTENPKATKKDMRQVAKEYLLNED